VEEVAADLLAEIGADPVVRPDQRLRRGETAIYRNVLGNRAQRSGMKAASEQIETRARKILDRKAKRESSY
jgi:hypothetical protein